MSTSAPVRNLLKLTCVSFAEDLGNEGVKSSKLVWVPVIVSMDEIEPNIYALTICKAVLRSTVLEYVRDNSQHPLLSSVVSAIDLVDASQGTLSVTYRELVIRVFGVPRQFHLRFCSVDEWLQFTINANTGARLSEELTLTIDRKLAEVVAALPAEGTVAQHDDAVYSAYINVIVQFTSTSHWISKIALQLTGLR
ncbi:hypothetical protein C8T65DRAFT_695093 [Cerioporus squamosus]|nr:hypothetical protein C8T65DRAFT_695093 [Cerioporus squamosus]